MPLFWVKIDHDARLPYQTNNTPGNWEMGQNTPQAMGKDVLGTFMPHPGAQTTLPYILACYWCISSLK